MPFLAFSNVDCQFGAKKLTQRSYTTGKALPKISRIKIIDKKEFAKAALDGNSETFVVYIAAIEFPTTMPIYLSRALQVKDNPTLVALQQNKTSTKILTDYFDYADVFSLDLAMELPENTGIKKHAIKLIDGKQPPYGLIYAFNLVELKTLKTYIETHLKTEFIKLSKSPTGASKLYHRKLDNSLRRFVNY